MQNNLILHAYVDKINLEKIPAGLYYIEIACGTEKEYQKLQVVR